MVVVEEIEIEFSIYLYNHKTTVIPGRTMNDATRKRIYVLRLVELDSIFYLVTLNAEDTVTVAVSK